MRGYESHLIGAEVEHPEPGFELIAWKRVKIRTFSFDLLGSSLSKGLLLLRGGDMEVYGGRIGEVEVILWWCESRQALEAKGGYVASFMAMRWL
ncbi:hypothetical protein Tco_0719504 [Tanacetum coccineum]